MRRPDNQQKGFSLIELVMVIGIIGLLSVSVRFGTRNLIIKAKRLQGQVMVKHVDSLFATYILDNEGSHDVEVMRSDWGSQEGTNAYFTTKDGCHTDNVLNFQVDCLKVNYAIFIVQFTPVSGRRSVQAQELEVNGERRVFTHLKGDIGCKDVLFEDGDGDLEGGEATKDTLILRDGVFVSHFLVPENHPECQQS